MEQNTQHLNPTKLRAMTLPQLLEFLSQNYSKYKTEYTELSDPVHPGYNIFEVVLIDDIVNIQVNNTGDCNITIFHERMSSNPAKILIEQRHKHKEYLIAPYDKNYTSVIDLYTKCAGHKPKMELLDNPKQLLKDFENAVQEAQKVAQNAIADANKAQNDLKAARQKQKKIYNRWFAFYVAALVVMFGIFQAGMQVSQKHKEVALKEYCDKYQKQLQHDCDSICDASQRKLDSLNAAIEQREAALKALNNKKRPQHTK